MNAPKKVVMLIDADNVSADVIEQAMGQVMAEQGAIHVRRAYCTAESALANLKLFKAHSIRPIVNLSTGKNSTDIALAVDAVDLVIGERPELVVIVSSDSDFAPLVIKLREKGCRVEGIGQQGKTGVDSKPVYDAFTDIAHRKAGGAGASTVPRKRAPAARRELAPAPAPPPMQTKPAALPPPSPPPLSSPPPPPAAAAPAKRARSRKPKAAAAEAPPPATAAPKAPPLPDALRQILAVLPELVGGEPLSLQIAAERLHSESLIGKNATSTSLFRKYPDWFVLTPERQPHKVQFRGQDRGQPRG